MKKWKTVTSDERSFILRITLLPIHLFIFGQMQIIFVTLLFFERKPFQLRVECYEINTIYK